MADLIRSVLEQVGQRLLGTLRHDALQPQLRPAHADKEFFALPLGQHFKINLAQHHRCRQNSGALTPGTADQHDVGRVKALRAVRGVRVSFRAFISAGRAGFCPNRPWLPPRTPPAAIRCGHPGGQTSKPSSFFIAENEADFTRKRQNGGFQVGITPRQHRFATWRYANHHPASPRASPHA